MNKQIESGLDRKQRLQEMLRRDLARVEAPAELWGHLQGARLAKASDTVWPRAWALAAALAIVVAVLAVGMHEPPAPLAASASGVVAAGHLEFQSGDPAQIRAWLNAQAGIDVALPVVPQPSVRLLGASVVNRVEPAVQVVYRVGNREASLLVEKTSRPEGAGAGGARHADLKADSNGGKITWVMHGQMYTLECFGPEDARIACLLCHAS
jgi:hypothetical protein